MALRTSSVCARSKPPHPHATFENRRNHAQRVVQMPGLFNDLSRCVSESRFLKCNSQFLGLAELKEIGPVRQGYVKVAVLLDGAEEKAELTWTVLVRPKRSRRYSPRA